MVRPRSGIAVAACFAFAACVEEPVPIGPVPDGLTVVARTSTAIAVTFGSEGQEVALDAHLASETSAAASVVVNGKAFEVSVDWGRGTIDSDGHSNALSLDEKDALAAFAEALEVELAPGAARLESIATGQVAHLARAPIEVEMGVESTGPAARPDDGVSYSTANDGRVHIKKGSLRCARYDGNGNVHRFCATVGADWGRNDCGWGDYDCMGRCGAGCGTGSYCLDCLEHDACSENFCGDDRCNDEWRNARDDYLLGC